MGLKTMVTEEEIKRGAMVGEVRLEDGTGEKSVVFVTWGEGTMLTTTVEVWKVGGGRGVEVVSREWTDLTVETKEGGVPREGGSPKTQDGGEEVVPMEV